MAKKRKRTKTQWYEYPTFRKMMKYVEPKDFHEENYFSPDGEDADSWRRCWVYEKLLLLTMIVMGSLKVWWALPVIFFPLSVIWFYRLGIEGKAGTGYPSMEVGDMIGILFLSTLSLLVSLIWLASII